LILYSEIEIINLIKLNIYHRRGLVGTFAEQCPDGNLVGALSWKEDQENEI
jgi:hypothetical protein